jgi:hypothetical protein
MSFYKLDPPKIHAVDANKCYSKEEGRGRTSLRPHHIHEVKHVQSNVWGHTFWAPQGIVLMLINISTKLRRGAPLMDPTHSYNVFSARERAHLLGPTGMSFNGMYVNQGKKGAPFMGVPPNEK